MERKNILVYGGNRPVKVMHARFDVVKALTGFGIDVKFDTTHFKTPHADVYFVHDGSVEFVTQARRFDAAFYFPEDLYKKWVVNKMNNVTSETNLIRYLVDLELGGGTVE